MPTMHAANEAFKLKLQYGADAPVAPSQLICARRDSAAFQLIINNDTNYSLNIGLGDWYSARGGKRPGYETSGPHRRLRLAVEAPFSLEVRLEEFLTDDDGAKKADLLLAQSVRESDANTPSAVWVEVQVPADAEPGEYSVTAHLYAALYQEDECEVATLTLPLRVMPFVLPEPKDWSFYLDLWQHNANIARKHDVPLWSDAHFKVLERYVRTLADLGQKAVTVCVSEIPWSGQSCFLNQEYGGNLFEYSIVGITRELDGRYTYDYTNMQRYIDLCHAAGICDEIEVFGLVNLWSYQDFIPTPPCEEYPEPIRLRYLDKADGCMKYMRRASEIEDYIKALEHYFMQTGQIARVRVAADEPANTEKYRASLQRLSEIAPSFRFKTAINHAEFINEFGDKIEDFVPYLRCATKAHTDLIRYREKYPKKRFLFYVCTGICRPNTFLRSDLIESRMLPLMASLLNLDGFLRWNYTVWPENPRAELRFSRFEAGDTNFVYPAYNGDVLLSLRYKNLRRGIIDFEIARIYREKHPETGVKNPFSSLLYIQEPYAYYEAMKKGGIALHAKDWEAFNAIKAALLEELQ